MIYFIQSGDYVKIGYCYRINSIAGRVQKLQIGNPITLSLLHVIEGTIQEELAMHKTFKQYHVRGEWFELSYEIMKFIETTINLPLPPICRIPRRTGLYKKRNLLS